MRNERNKQLFDIVEITFDGESNITKQETLAAGLSFEQASTYFN